MEWKVAASDEAVGLQRAWDLVAARPGAARLCVLRGDRVLLDRWKGCHRDDLFITFSVSKPFVALCVHLLADRGLLDLDDPVAAHWPAYARNGKESITIRHVLTHRAGVPMSSGSFAGDVLAMADWDRSVRLAERARPRWPVGQVPAYHVLSYGFILGELVRRVSGRPVEEFLAGELVDPLGLPDLRLGLPAAWWSRRVPLRAGHPSEVGRRVLFNRRGTRRAVIPAAGISTTARDLALFYRMLLNGGEGDGRRVLPAAAIDAARRESCDGELDRTIQRKVRWGHGFQLGGGSRAMGQTASREAFGHNGSSICNAWCDPSRDLVFAYTTNLALPRREAVAHQQAVSDAVIASCV
ncbi:serine hydrolase domain-containing protein [Fodinicola acaciae]|uniref:serine hydrolase domain-containing protein n=1 Tax=Fodinicola acaciae TaxID=2681555 RepID=UPI0013D874CF|nr:serine hydrolase domain-containing protein [Fodinicola acaciae]